MLEIDQERIESLEGKALKKQRNMPVYECVCGMRILIVPDLAEMIKAIRRHLIVHKKLTGDRLSERTLTEEILKTLINHAIF